MATTTSVPAPDAQSQPGISPVGRVFGVFFSPKPTFEDIVRKPSWVLPFVLLTLFSIGVTFAGGPFRERKRPRPCFVTWMRYINAGCL